jgi:hypothetical protein
MSRDWRGYIDVTDIDLRLLVQVAYSGSRPQGLGFLHAKPGGLDEETLNEIVAQSETGRGEIHLDYLHGRSMKFNVRKDRETGRRYVDLDWYDHGRRATEHLLREVGLPNVEEAIAKAAAEKDEKEREWQAKQEAGAKVGIAFLEKEGGHVARDHEAIRDWFKGDESSPAYKLYDALNDACSLKLADYRDGGYALNDAGRAFNGSFVGKVVETEPQEA